MIAIGRTSPFWKKSVKAEWQVREDPAKPDLMKKARTPLSKGHGPKSKVASCSLSLGARLVPNKPQGLPLVGQGYETLRLHDGHPEAFSHAHVNEC
jgi:hypothetical protein